MDSFPFKKQDLIKYHNDKEVVKATANQVIKDFSSFGYDISFPENLNMAYDSLFDQLAPVIYELLRLDSSKLYSLLYCIDLNEQSIKKGLEEMKSLEIQDSLTHIILDRELKKVLTRRYFSKNKNI